MRGGIVVPIAGFIDLVLAPFLARTLREAESAGAAAVLLDPAAAPAPARARRAGGKVSSRGSRRVRDAASAAYFVNRDKGVRPVTVRP